jgi:hypothetical protein
MPRYEMEIEDANGKTSKVVVDERVSLVEALANKGVSKQPYGIRIYNQKYYPVNFDAEKGTLYLKKVNIVLFRVKEEHVLLRLESSS